MPGVRRNLDFGSEFWGPVQDQPAVEALALLNPGYVADPDKATYLVTSHLLLDTINAAGAVEYTAGRIQELIWAVQDWSDENATIDPTGPWPEYGFGVSTSE